MPLLDTIINETPVISSELITSLTTAIVGLLLALIAFMVGVVKNPALQEGVVKFFGAKLNKLVIDKKDLSTHELFLKTRDLIKKQLYTSDFNSLAKNDLFNDYMAIYGRAIYDECINIINLELDTISNAELKNKIHEAITISFNRVDGELATLLRSRNPNPKQLNLVMNLLKQWKQDYQQIIIDNVFMTFSTTRITNNQYLVDKVFIVLTIGLDFLVKNGVESFNKLNGQLDTFLAEDGVTVYPKDK